MAPTDRWQAGELYEPYVGRWSRPVASAFVAWLDPLPDKDWLDVGCGTGALTQTITAAAEPRSVIGVDPSDAFLDYAAALTDASASFRIGDALDLPVEDASVDFAVSGLVLNFVPDSARAIAEQVRAVRPGGVVATYVWDYADKMQLMRSFWDAAVALDPGVREMDESTRFPICKPEPLRTLYQDAGLMDIDGRAIDVPTRFLDFDDYWSPFLGGQGPAPGYAMSLDEDRRVALRERIRSALPIAADGSIDLIARAWAVKGRRR